MPPDARAIAGVDDSKRSRPASASALAKRIRERAVAVGLGAASVREIDRLNIYHASVLAMRRALAAHGDAASRARRRTRPIRTLGVAHTAVVDGDARCYSVACASIVAKVTRDRVMHALARRHPAYPWERNVGYATANRLRGIFEHGITPHHRKSFLPCSQISSISGAPTKW